MNGRELVNAARRMRPDIKVLYMTGYAEDSLSDLGGVDADVAIIIKPFTRQQLVKKVNLVLAPTRNGPAV
jgi:two-component SAPR family response regulator